MARDPSSAALLLFSANCIEHNFPQEERFSLPTSSCASNIWDRHF